MKKIKKFTPQDWQTDPDSLTTSRVQFWHDGVMLTLISLEEARQEIINKKAFVVSDQAISTFDK